MKMNRILPGIVAVILLFAPSAAASDYTLGVFGNANEDDTINMQDVTYTELIILEYRDQTELSDAKYDGKINMQDVTQIELIILGKEKELTFTDLREDAVTINKPLGRVIIGPSTTYALMRAINAGDALVGICKYAIDRKVFFPELDESMSIGGYPPDFEKMFALNPDLVIAGSPTCSWGDEFAETCEAAGISFAMPAKPTPEDLNEEEIAKLGYIFGKVEGAYTYTGVLRDNVADLTKMTAEIPEEDKPRVYIEAMKDYKACGVTSYPNMICEIAGGKNVAYDTIPDHCAVVDPEWVVEQNPDIIIKMMSSGKSGYEIDDSHDMVAARDAIMNRPELSNVKAVENGRVYVISCSIACGYSYINGIPHIMKVFHPERFSDSDPTEIHQRDVDFQGLDFDVKERGVFIYPPFVEN